MENNDIDSIAMNERDHKTLIRISQDPEVYLEELLHKEFDLFYNGIQKDMQYFRE